MNYFEDPEVAEILALELQMENERYEEIQRVVNELHTEHPTLAFDMLPIGACPMQADGDYDDETFYFRYRYDTARMEYGDKVVVRENVLGDELAGILDPEHFKRLFSEMLYAVTHA